MISSQAAIVFSYVLYLIGATEFDIDKTRIRQATAEFYFMAALTGLHQFTRDAFRIRSRIDPRPRGWGCVPRETAGDVSNCSD